MTETCANVTGYDCDYTVQEGSVQQIEEDINSHIASAHPDFERSHTTQEKESIFRTERKQLEGNDSLI
jgi:predicted small metal-binding protein